MKKKIIFGVFLLLVLITAIIFIAGAISSYNYETILMINGWDLVPF